MRINREHEIRKYNEHNDELHQHNLNKIKSRNKNATDEIESEFYNLKQRDQMLDYKILELK